MPAIVQRISIAMTWICLVGVFFADSTMVHHQKTTIYHLEEYAYTLFKRRTSKSKYII